MIITLQVLPSGSGFSGSQASCGPVASASSRRGSASPVDSMVTSPDSIASVHELGLRRIYTCSSTTGSNRARRRDEPPARQDRGRYRVVLQPTGRTSIRTSGGISLLVIEVISNFVWSCWFSDLWIRLIIRTYLSVSAYVGKRVLLSDAAVRATGLVSR